MRTLTGDSPPPTPTNSVPAEASPTPTSIPTIPVGCNAPHGVACPILLNISPEASPGDAINIAGGTFTSDARVILQVISDDGIPIYAERYDIPVLNNHFALLQARIPANLSARALWAVWVEQGGVASNALFVNQAKATHQSTRKIASGDELTLWGRALSFGGSDSHHPKVLFVAGGNSIQGTVSAEDPYRMRVIAPASLVPGVSYKVKISNGVGGSLGFSDVEDEVVAIGKGSDPLGLGVWWANEIPANVWSNVYDVTSDPFHATGNGLTDDTAAIQAALNLAGSTGGGTVYLPPGNYRITTGLLILYPKIVLLGAGESQTKILYGANGASTMGAIYFAENNVKLAGISSLTVENKKTSGNGNFSITTYTKTGIEKIFVNKVKLLLGSQGQALSFDKIDHLLISDCDTTLTKRQDFSGMNHSALWVTEGEDDIIRNNTIRYDVGRIQVQLSRHLQLLNNTFIRNGALDALDDRVTNQIETGGPEFAFDTDAVLDGNNAVVSPLPPADSYGDFNDSEVYMTQGSIYVFYSRGEVSSATATTITDANKNWTLQDLTPPLPGVRGVVAITKGEGLGQWRYITGGSGTTLTVDKPFDIIPTSDSAYTITEWTVENPFLLDNSSVGGRWCINIYSGAVGLNLHRNTCIDSGNIQLLADDLYPGFGGNENYYRFLGWNTSFTQNLVQTTVARLLPSSIKINLEQFTQPSGYPYPEMHGNTVYMSEMLNNTIIAGIPNVPELLGLFSADGRLYSTIGGAGHETAGHDAYGVHYGVLGTVVAHNTSENYEGVGSYFKGTTADKGNACLVFDD